MTFGPGAVIRDFRIIRLLGEGGMSEVYLAPSATATIPLQNPQLEFAFSQGK